MTEQTSSQVNHRDPVQQSGWLRRAAGPCRALAAWVVAAGIVLAAAAGVYAGAPVCPPACPFPPGQEVAVSLEWRPAVVQAAVGETVSIGLYAVAAEAEPDTFVAGLQAIIVWDPLFLEVQSLVNDSPYDWLLSRFPNDSPLDDLNHGATQSMPPDNDGDAYYEAQGDFNKPIGDGPALIPSEGLRVVTFRFKVLAETGGTQITVPDTRGQYTCSAVFMGNGKAAGCDIKQNLGSATVTTQEIPLAIVGSDPPDGAIDARQPSTLDGSQQFGWNAITLEFGASAAGVMADDLEVTSSCDATPPAVMSVSPKASALLVEFDDRIPVGVWTTIRHVPSNTSVRIGFQPGDVDSNGVAAPLDILALIDHLNGILSLPSSSTDINRSGQTNPQDILRLVDILNGAGAYQGLPSALCGG